MIKKTIRFLSKIFLTIICTMLVGIALYCSFRMGYSIALRNHGNVYITEVGRFSESARELKNPNRGFYFMCGFRISDDRPVDYYASLFKSFSNSNASLVMIQINLQEYAEGLISEKGLEEINNLFHAMSQFDKQYIVRFLYDWNGENEIVEPERVETILGHMEQLRIIFLEYHDIIYLHQGLFIGNWGEMNGTAHLSSMKELTEKLLEVTDNEIFLSVRMPAQWRKITQIAEPNISSYAEEHISRRIGLFNDGIMGNYSDYGTYGKISRSEVGDFTHWNRTEELIFQQELCKYVPNGGEVIKDNEYNDFVNALANLKQMHISYLNWDYDRSVLDKWKEYVIADDSVYHGMDGLTYIERHLGYRLLIKNVGLDYKKTEDVLTVKIDLQNVGFAPVYKPEEVYLQIVNVETKASQSYLLETDLSKLSGGNEDETILPIIYEQKLTGFNEGTYEIYFWIKDVDSATPIYLGNEQEMEEYGYKIGTIHIEGLRESIDKFLIKIKKK